MGCFNMLENIDQWIMVALAVVGGASIIVDGFLHIAKITPSTKDDYYAGKAKRALGWLVDILSKVARNPK